MKSSDDLLAHAVAWAEQRSKALPNRHQGPAATQSAKSRRGLAVYPCCGGAGYHRTDCELKARGIPGKMGIQAKYGGHSGSDSSGRNSKIAGNSVTRIDHALSLEETATENLQGPVKEAAQAGENQEVSSGGKK